MDYKKKYNKALARAMEELKVCGSQDCDAARQIFRFFPELKEDNDERIRKGLIKAVSGTFEGNKLFGTDVTREEALAWLEKQGEHKPYGQRKECEDCQFNYAGECKGYCALKRNEQKPILDVKASDWYVSKVDGKIHNMYYSVDKVEPKFHKGDWIIHQGTENIYQVIARIDNQYQLKYGDNYTIQKCADVDRCARLWSIQDAKDGDVLCYHCPTTAFYLIGIFKRVAPKNELYGGTYRNHVQYGGYSSIEKYTLQVALGNDELHHCGSIACPATKEQRDLLFQKMKEAGYEWDTEKKEVKKIEHKTLNADKVIEWMKTHGNLFPIVTIKINDVIAKFKKDFELC